MFDFKYGLPCDKLKFKLSNFSTKVLTPKITKSIALRHVFSFMHGLEVAQNCALVCKKWYATVWNALVWSD